MSRAWMIAREASKLVAAGVTASVIAVGVYLVLTGGGLRVDGTRADCEAKFVGQRCMIVWVPESSP